MASNLRLDLRADHAENGAVQEDVLAARELGMKARADFEQARRRGRRGRCGRSSAA